MWKTSFRFQSSFLHRLSFLHVGDPKILNIPRPEENFNSLYSLRHLWLESCRSLASFRGGLEHLTTVKKWIINDCQELHLLSNEDMEEGMPWKVLNHLKSLELSCLPKLVTLPRGLQRLMNLRSLGLPYNHELKNYQ